MLTLSDLVLHATSDVWFCIYNTDGELLIEGDKNDLENDYNMNLKVNDYWIEKEETLYVHVLQEGEI